VAAVLLNADIVAGNAARQWLAGDSGNPRILCCVKISTSESVTIGVTIICNHRRCFGVMKWWACSLLMFATSHADAGCKSLWADCAIVTLCCVTITWQQIFKGSAMVVGVLPHVTVERRHLWQKMLRDSDC